MKDIPFKYKHSVHSAVSAFTCSMRKTAEACVDPLALLGGDCKDDVLRFAFYTGMRVRMRIMLYVGFLFITNWFQSQQDCQSNTVNQVPFCNHTLKHLTLSSSII